MNIILDGNIIINKETLYKELKRQINNKEFIGNNLDALYDVLSSNQSSINLEIIHHEDLKKHLGEYLDSLLAVLNDTYKE